MLKHRSRWLLPATLAFCFIVVAVLVPHLTHAAQGYDPGWKIIPNQCLQTGDCSVNDFVQMFVNLAALGLKILPYVAMVMMIWAGYNLIMAGGNPEKVQAGKKMITSIVLGIIIVIILAWAWSYFVVFIMTGSTKIFPGYPWEREWWGGGTTTTAAGTNGCCTKDKVGCLETTKTECDKIATTNFTDGACYPQFMAPCDGYGFSDTCCVPDDATSTFCYVSYNKTNPVNKGCLGWPEKTTYNHAKCENLAVCSGKTIVQPK